MWRWSLGRGGGAEWEVGDSASGLIAEAVGARESSEQGC